MSKNTKDLILIGAALVGAYAAWLQIRKDRQHSQQFNDWFTDGAFSTGSFDFYGNRDSYNWLEGSSGAWPGI